MWTEILTEDIAVTHVGGMCVLSPLASDVHQRQLHAAQKELEQRKARKRHIEQLQNLNEKIQKDIEFMEILQEAGYEPAYQTR